MSTAPHPALRRLWTEATAADRAIREICVLQHAWDWAIDSTLDLPILDSDELVRPLFEFGAFEPPIAEALDRIRAEREPTEDPDQIAIHQLPSQPKDADSPRETWSLPPKREVTPARRAAFDSPPASHQTKTETFATGAQPGEPHRRDVPERSDRRAPLSPFETRSVLDHKVREDIRDVEGATGKRLSNKSIPVKPAKPAITLEAIANRLANSARVETSTLEANVPQAVDRVPMHSVDATATRSNFVSIPNAEKVSRPSISADGLTVVGEKKTDGDTASRSGLFDQILGRAVERYARAARERQIGAEDVSSKPVSGEPLLALQAGPGQSPHDFPRTGLQRLAARARPSAGLLAEESRWPQQPEMASFAAATCFSSIESAEFATHLETLLRREMTRHGINAEDLQQ